MKILIAYASNSGGTYLAGTIIRSVLEDVAVSVVMKKASEVIPSDVIGYDVILLGSPSWGVDGKEGQPQETISDLLHNLKEQNLVGKHFALFGCGDSSYLQFCGAVDIMENSVREFKGIQLVPSLRLDSFYFELEKNRQLVNEWAKNLAASLPISQLV